MGDEDQDRDPGQALGVSFGSFCHEREEGDDEVDEGQAEGRGTPRAFHAVLVPEDLLRHVRVPHQHVLGEGDVGPEHHEGEEKAPQVVEVVEAHSLEAALLLEADSGEADG